MSMPNVNDIVIKRMQRRRIRKSSETGNERYYTTVCALHGLFYLLACANNAMVEMCFLFHIFILTWQRRHQF
jgi:hypothetical protein